MWGRGGWRYTGSVCMSVCTHIPHVCRSLWRPEEGVEYPGTRVADDCEPPNVGTGKQTQIIFKKIKTIKHWVTSPIPVPYFEPGMYLIKFFYYFMWPQAFQRTSRNKWHTKTKHRKEASQHAATVSRPSSGPHIPIYRKKLSAVHAHHLGGNIS